MTKAEIFKDIKLPSPVLEKKYLVVTHNDLDGEGPAILMNALYGSKNVDVIHCTNAEMSRKIEEEVMKNQESHQYDAIIACDISCERDVAERIDGLPNHGDAIILDHHGTAVPKLEGFDWAMVVPGMPDDSFRRELVPSDAPEDKVMSSGTSLLYDLIEYSDLDRFLSNPEKAKEIAHTIATYDTWMWQNVYSGAEICGDYNSLYFLQGDKTFEQHALDYINGVREQLIDGADREELARDAEKTAERVKKVMKGAMTARVTIDGREYATAFVFSSSEKDPPIFEALKKEYPGMDLYTICPKQRVSFRAINDGINVGTIAARMGGGGHPGAAGISGDLEKNLQVYMDMIGAEKMEVDTKDGPKLFINKNMTPQIGPDYFKNLQTYKELMFIFDGLPEKAYLRSMLEQLAGENMAALTSGSPSKELIDICEGYQCGYPHAGRIMAAANIADDNFRRVCEMTQEGWQIQFSVVRYEENNSQILANTAVDLTNTIKQAYREQKSLSRALASTEVRKMIEEIMKNAGNDASGPYACELELQMTNGRNSSGRLEIGRLSESGLVEFTQADSDVMLGSGNVKDTLKDMGILGNYDRKRGSNNLER